MMDLLINYSNQQNYAEIQNFKVVFNFLNYSIKKLKYLNIKIQKTSWKPSQRVKMSKATLISLLKKEFNSSNKTIRISQKSFGKIMNKQDKSLLKSNQNYANKENIFMEINVCLNVLKNFKTLFVLMTALMDSILTFLSRKTHVKNVLKDVKLVMTLAIANFVNLNISFIMISVWLIVNQIVFLMDRIAKSAKIHVKHVINNKTVFLTKNILP